MNGPVDTAEYRPWREAFTAAHPGADLTVVGDQAHACLPRPGGGVITVTRPTWKDLRAELGKLFPAGPAGS